MIKGDKLSMCSLLWSSDSMRDLSGQVSWVDLYWDALMAWVHCFIVDIWLLDIGCWLQSSVVMVLSLTHPITLCRLSCSCTWRKSTEVLGASSSMMSLTSIHCYLVYIMLMLCRGSWLCQYWLQNSTCCAIHNCSYKTTYCSTSDILLWV